MGIAANEDAFLTALRALNLFALVESLGRSGEPDMIIYPAAFAYFSGEGRSAREITAEYHVQVRAQNTASEAAAARDAYTLIDAARDAIHGKPLFGNGTFARCIARELTGWNQEESIIEYTLKFTMEQTISIGM
jgi:hypothetical protein